MLRRKKSLASPKNLLISILTISVVACSSGGTESTNNPTDSASPSSATTSATPQATASSTSVASLNPSEIQFKQASKNTSSGYFDGVNGSGRPKIEVSKTTPINASGWAIIIGQQRPADSVIITYGENNTLVTVAPVNQLRLDVAKFFKGSPSPNFGWTATLNPSTLPGSPVTLKAWAYNSATKEATQLNNTHQIVISE